MKRRSPALLAGLVVGSVLLLTWHESGKKRHKVQEPTSIAQPEPKPEKSAEPEEQEDEPTALPPVATALDPAARLARFSLMPDGSPVPPLSAEAPTRVKLGVALFRYQGAEAPPKSDRSKEDALELAKKAAATAKTDFAAAVKSADRGSSENLGWIQRGVLEPAVEYAVFSIQKGDVSAEPIDTPRGYWVFKRVR